MSISDGPWSWVINLLGSYVDTSMFDTPIYDPLPYNGPSGTSRSLTVVDHDEPVFIIFLTATGSPSTTV